MNAILTTGETPPRIGNVWAVGRNYADHAKELGHAVPSKSADEPLIFLKAGSSIVRPGKPIRLPRWSNDVHHEAEIAVRFGPALALAQVAAAIDLTARDVQAKLKEKQQPWTLAKSFTDSCALGPLSDVEEGEDLQALEFWLDLNGARKQSGRARDMIFTIAEVARYVRARFPVEPGDILLTGTPAGVGPMRPGDRVSVGIAGRPQAEWECVLAPE